MNGECSDGARPAVMEDWLTRDELSGEIGVAVNTLKKWASQQVGPVFVRVGPKVYYSRSSVRLWLEALEARAKERRGKLH